VQADRLFAGLWIDPSDHKAMTMFLDLRSRLLAFLEVGDADRVLQPVIGNALVPLPAEPVGLGARWRTRGLTRLEDQCAIEESTFTLTSFASGRPVIDGDTQILALTGPCASRDDAARALTAVRGKALSDAPHVDGVFELTAATARRRAA
jgi:hypothetical protein